MAKIDTNESDIPCWFSIITRYEHPPIPSRDYDWSAVREDYEPGDTIGFGKTERDAINDLLEQEDERAQ